MGQKMSDQRRIIVVGRDRTLLKPRRPDIVTGLRIEGIVKSVELIDARTGIIKRKLGPFPNLIVDAGLNWIGSDVSGTAVNNIINHLAVGTNNAVPAVNQTALGAELARTNSNGGFADVYASGPSYAYWEGVRTRVFLEAQANGNLTELGFFSAAAGGSMWCRQLFLDALMNPTTITKTAADQLRVIYAWRVYPHLTAINRVIDISGVSTSCDSRAVSVATAYGWGRVSNFSGVLTGLGDWSNVPTFPRATETDVLPTPTTTISNNSDSGVAAVSGSLSAYVNGTFYRDVTSVWEPANANFPTGIGRVSTCPFNAYSTAHWGVTTFAPKVDKTDVKRFTFTQRWTWGRV